MTRLTERDVAHFAPRVGELERVLGEMAGVDLRTLALTAASCRPGQDPLTAASVAAVPVTSGEGLIVGFTQAVCEVLRHLGSHAWVTEQTDVPGICEAVQAGAEVLFLADDDRFVALNVRHGRIVENDRATAEGYVLALELAAGGLQGRDVLVLGLGPIGLAAVRRLLDRGAAVHVVEPRPERLQSAREVMPRLRPVTLTEGLQRCDLVFDATPAGGFIDAGDLGDASIAVVPGVPSAFTPAAQAALGPCHLHDPLAIGVAVMAARALA